MQNSKEAGIFTPIVLLQSDSAYLKIMGETRNDIVMHEQKNESD